jgi:putative nucleotidyltransferase with HDIG domain
LISRILNLSQTLELFYRERGAEAAIQVAKERSRRWFEPKLVKLAIGLVKKGVLFAELHDDAQVRKVLIERQPVEDAHSLTEDRIDAICVAFASVVDAKSPYTFRHSLGVTSAATAIAERMGFDDEAIPFIRRAALLHDVGKLSVPNTILEKPSRLDDAEWQIVKRHPYHTREILMRIPGFEDLAEVAAQHHEKLDGSGYWRGLRAQELSPPARLLAVADIYDALAAERPYRGALPPEKVFEIIGKETPSKLDGDCVQALRESVFGGELETIANLRALHFAIESSKHRVPTPEVELI